ncbi:uncharacterized protein LOC116776712 [Danaus plexippus]|uniref:uncharacterized protein LOC116776712 n=1 Tax=Danaus plexippus TaxID=13037 RepID=UPI002AB175DE|nr:uncharacterized protein LOC116776712 [Danaus plexippus]
MYAKIVFLAVVAAAQAQLTNNGSCNFESLQIEISAGTSFQPRKMYEISRISNNWQSGQCASWELKNITNSSLPTVHMTEVVNRKLVERNATVLGTSIGNTPVASLDFNDFSSNFTILGLTDEFLILYACSDHGETKKEYIWRLSNNTVLSESAIVESNKILNNNNFGNLTWNTISHTSESCQTGGAVSLKVSSFIVLLVGLALSKVF